MKKLIFLFVLISTFGLANAEKIFCKVIIERWTHPNNGRWYEVFVGINKDIDNSCKIKNKQEDFKSEISVLNCMSSLGWELEHVDEPSGDVIGYNKIRTTSYLFSKETTEEEALKEFNFIK